MLVKGGFVLFGDVEIMFEISGFIEIWEAVPLGRGGWVVLDEGDQGDDEWY